jgi:hypothetical protein
MRIALLLTIGLLVGSPAAAVTIGFGCLTNNNLADCDIDEAQFTVEAFDLGGNQVLFTFNNSGPDASKISEIYFDDGTLLGIASVIDGPGVLHRGGSFLCFRFPQIRFGFCA